jgi:uracil-DNA glycosylase family 4
VNYRKLKPASCAGCTLIDAPGPVWGKGDPQRARLIYIAQNPGREEAEPANDPLAWGPLQGPSGRVFNRQLAEVSINRYDIFVTNCVKCVTPGNREPTPLELARCRPLVDQELARCRADTVVLAGAVAFKAYVESRSTLSPSYKPSDSIFERMGCVEQLDGRKWIGTIHPAFVMRMAAFRLEALDHLRKAWAVSGIELPLPRVIENPTESEIENHREAARREGIFADDVESQNIPKDVEEDDYVGGEWEMDMVGFSAIPYEAIVLPRAQTGEWQSVWARPDIIQCEHNGESDRYHLEKVAPQLNLRFDTMLAHHWLHSNIYKYLKPQCVRLYTNLPYYNRDLEHVSRKLYAGMDNIATLLIAKRQFEELKREGLWDLYWQLGQPILPINEEMRRRGLRVDVRKALLYQRILLRQVEQGNELIERMLGPGFNPRSSKQKAHLWYKVWKLPEQFNIDKKTRAKKLTTDDGARVELRRWIAQKPERGVEYKNARILFDLLDFTSEKKKLAEYMDRISPDERIHAFVKAHGTATFREATKPNVQNWPTWRICCGKEKCECGAQLDSLRSIVIPDDPDDLILSTDFDQIELWTYAAQFKIKWLLDTYETGEYIYGAVFEEVLKKPFFIPGKPRTKKNRLDSVSDAELLRAKAVPLGFLYGRTGESVAAEHGWPAAEGRELHRAWFKRVPELQRAHDRIKYDMQQRGRLRPPPGMVLHYPVVDLQGLNCFGQTPAAMMLASCKILCDQEFKARAWANTRIMVCVHDSMAFNVAGARSHPERLVEMYEDVVRPILTRPVPWLDGFRYRHSAKVGTMWDWQMKDYDDWKGTV